MSDIHVLDGGIDGKSWRVAMHFDVPDTDNNVGMNHRAALVASGIGGETVLPDGDGTNGTVIAAEKALIESGGRYEHVVTIPALESGGTTSAQLRTSIRHFYGRKKTDVLNGLAMRLKYFGYTESEA